ncbi:FitA-like ribbon-helix-helix domain-containing protein [Nocardioides albus]|uniref:Plasmid stability protein n=1 Tax=Nocardioides albus TaxID=1841 RepID=A0A7W5F9K8_9ACTN|nr:hypothetical protein [Nocardioides albus]MBB3090414.1 plasmid stability protein [Nocardioides albus]
MVAMQIRDVPEPARDALARRAQAKGQSLQAYLREMVLREAAFANNLDVLDEVAEWRTGGEATLDDVLAARDDARRDVG